MKNFIIIPFILFLLNCNVIQEESQIDETSLSSCEDIGKLVFQGKNRSGTLRYSESKDKYYIRSVTEGSYDEVLIAFICNPSSELVDNFKEKIDIVFSGDFFEIENNKHTGPVGTDFYYVKLSELKFP